jgi:hypothetical protein
MKHSVVTTKAETPKSMDDKEFFDRCQNVEKVFTEFKNVAISMKKLGLLSTYRQYELELFIQRNEHYLKGLQSTRCAIENKPIKEA